MSVNKNKFTLKYVGCSLRKFPFFFCMIVIQPITKATLSYSTMQAGAQKTCGEKKTPHLLGIRS